MRLGAPLFLTLAGACGDTPAEPAAGCPPGPEEYVVAVVDDTPVDDFVLLDDGVAWLAQASELGRVFYTDYETCTTRIVSERPTGFGVLASNGESVMWAQSFSDPIGGTVVVLDGDHDEATEWPCDLNDCGFRGVAPLGSDVYFQTSTSTGRVSDGGEYQTLVETEAYCDNPGMIEHGSEIAFVGSGEGLGAACALGVVDVASPLVGTNFSSDLASDGESLFWASGSGWFEASSTEPATVVEVDAGHSVGSIAAGPDAFVFVTNQGRLVLRDSDGTETRLALNALPWLCSDCPRGRQGAIELRDSDVYYWKIEEGEQRLFRQALP